MFRRALLPLLLIALAACNQATPPAEPKQDQD